MNNKDREAFEAFLRETFVLSSNDLPRDHYNIYTGVAYSRYFSGVSSSIDDLSRAWEDGAHCAKQKAEAALTHKQREIDALIHDIERHQDSLAYQAEEIEELRTENQRLRHVIADEMQRITEGEYGATCVTCGSPASYRSNHPEYELVICNKCFSEALKEHTNENPS